MELDNVYLEDLLQANIRVYVGPIESNRSNSDDVPNRDQLVVHMSDNCSNQSFLYLGKTSSRLGRFPQHDPIRIPVHLTDMNLNTSILINLHKAIPRLSTALLRRIPHSTPSILPQTLPGP